MSIQITGTTERNFAYRHNGPRRVEIQEMLECLSVDSLDQLAEVVVPEQIMVSGSLDLPAALSEVELLEDMRNIASGNQLFKSYIGLGYYDCITPPVILRNIIENPGWYTQYTPYQAEISQGRLEAMLNFQTMICDLTKMECANSSMLDEATAAAEAMTMCRRVLGRKNKSNTFFVSERCLPQTIAVVETRARALGINVVVGDHTKWDFSTATFGVLVQYPDADGVIEDYSGFFRLAHENGAMTVAAADLMSLVLLTPPGEFGADVAVGSSQRFGVPLGYGGPHAGYMATSESYKRQLPGRLVGVSVDSNGKPGLRLALQTREQHIRRDRATSNICTAQVLLAVVASMYAVYHGPDGLVEIATSIHKRAVGLAGAVKSLGYTVSSSSFFDTVHVIDGPIGPDELMSRALADGINLRRSEDGVSISIDETTKDIDLSGLIKIFGGDELSVNTDESSLGSFVRKSRFLEHPTFHRYRSETELLRYMNKLQSRDLSLTTSMIPLGSCTMKLNATAEMIPVTWREFGGVHPFVPVEQMEGYTTLFSRLEVMLAEITGFDAVSLQPNAGSQGEYAGLGVIRAWHDARGDQDRIICIIPMSAHGTNPASAVMAGMKVVPVKCDDAGNIDLEHLKEMAEKYSETLAAIMVTYPSTHGVFESTIVEICDIIHNNGGQVYLDGANMNAMLGLCKPGKFGADVCHLNLHKTFAIPHGGGGPGVGPICVLEHLAPHLPDHPLIEMGGEDSMGAVSAAPWGSSSVLPISYSFISMMGPDGLKAASQLAILNANYIAKRLAGDYPILYKGAGGWVAHECILDLRPITAASGVSVEDVAKRLMDYGFHAPTMSWPVAGTLMVEPTESEGKEELDRFCDAMISIRQEIREVEEGSADREVNLLTGSPHTAEALLSDAWDRPYSRERAGFPYAASREHKFWPVVGRVDNAWGDRNFACLCPSMESFSEDGEGV